MDKPVSKLNEIQNPHTFKSLSRLALAMLPTLQPPDGLLVPEYIMTVPTGNSSNTFFSLLPMIYSLIKKNLTLGS